MYTVIALVVCAILIMPLPMAAEEKSKSELPNLPEPPPIAKKYKRPKSKTEDKDTEPSRVRGTYEAFRYNGRLYMIRITPKGGKSYYLIDEEGNGKFKRSDLEPQINPPTWILKKF